MKTKKELTLALFSEIKNAERSLRIPFNYLDGEEGCLVGLNRTVLTDESSISLLSRWRIENAIAFPAQFEVTNAGTKIWCEKALFDAPDRVLFWVENNRKTKIGHVGLFRISHDGSWIEADNIVRGEKASDKGLMACAMKALLNWQINTLGIPESYLRVFGDNEHAINFYNKLGYEEIQRVPLFSERTPSRVDWKEIKDNPYKRAERYFVTMYLKNKGNENA